MQKYDYIIIGAGSAGCLLANRLSADPSVRVLVLEAGGKPRHPNLSIPAAFYKTYGTQFDWGYESIPQRHLNRRKVIQPRGKVLGGSSAINAMIYIRGHRYDYDSWAEAGNRGWSYEDLLPYFKRFEHQTRGADAYHGVKGELTVSDRLYTNVLSDSFVSAGRELGYPHNPDFNGERQSGFGQYQVTQRNGSRCSAYRAFLKPVLSRTNLRVLRRARTLGLILEGKQVSGVRYRKGGQEHRAFAQREVLLCAGAFGSPQLLLLSGIGPGADLRKLGIPVRHDLPGVGRNLQDHPIVPVAFTAKTPDSIDRAEDFPQVLRNVWNYLRGRKSPFNSNIAEAGAFLRTQPDEPAPDLQFHFGPAYFIDHGRVRPAGNGYSIGPTLLKVASRGELRLQSADPLEAPAIDPNYLADTADLERLVFGVRLAQQLGTTEAFAPHFADYYLPNRRLEDPEDLVTFVRQQVTTLYHPVGTCRMGQGPEAVVDDRLRVHGLSGVRVVDASIMPEIVRGNTNAPSMVIAERAADWIRNAG